MAVISTDFVSKSVQFKSQVFYFFAAVPTTVKSMLFVLILAVTCAWRIYCNYWSIFQVFSWSFRGRAEDGKDEVFGNF